MRSGLTFTLGLALLACGTVEPEEPLDLDRDGLTDLDDCDEADPDVNKEADELCDGLDNDCDGLVDEDAADATTWYLDMDGDDYGSVALSACDAPDHFVELAGDCNDLDARAHPLADEVCDGIDNNCDGGVDTNAEDAPMWYADHDGDGFAGESFTMRSCWQPNGYLAEASDCDDLRALVNPGMTEVCNNWLDDDCDGGPGACEQSGEVSLADAPYRLMGAEGDAYGLAVAAIDLSADGEDDLVASSRSQVRISWSPVPAWYDTNQAETRIDAPPEEGTGFGLSLADAGDLNADGWGDVAIGAPNDFDGVGAVYVFFGPLVNGQLAAEDADLVIGGLRPGDVFGARIASGDLDGDHLRDLVVSAQGEDGPEGEEGAVRVFYGPLSGGMLTAEDADVAIQGTWPLVGLGWNTAVMPDADGDGDDELVAMGWATEGNESYVGTVYYFEGPVAASGDAEALRTGLIRGDMERPYLGWSMALPGDLDGDGAPDLALGAPEASAYAEWGGAMRLYSGPFVGERAVTDAYAVFEGTVAEQRVGSHAAAGADLNHDGRLDLVVPVLGDEATPSRLAVFYGPLAGDLSIDHAGLTIVSPVVGDSAGFSLATGDVDQDRFDDLLIGAPFDATNGEEAGAVYVWEAMGK